VELVHPGFQLLADQRLDQADDVLRIVRETAQRLDLPLLSLEVELGPSQFEAVFGVADALQAADRMVWFRQGVKQALRRAGYLASFMCRPPFAQAIASGWHLHHSLSDLRDAGEPLFRAAGASGPRDAAAGAGGAAATHLGERGAAWLAGLLAHSHGMAALASPTVSGFDRFGGGTMSPLQAVWGRDNRGAMLRLIAHADGAGCHLENRLGEPAANPYLYIAAQVACGLDGWRRCLPAPQETSDPYATGSGASPSSSMLPRDLGAALDAFDRDPLWRESFGAAFVDLFLMIKRAELARHAQATDGVQWQAREYFERL
jgi:glutamine synthetase